MTGIIDWRQAWIDYDRAKPAPAAQDCWNDRAKDFEKKVGTSAYAELFLERLAAEPGASVMDVGCGSGVLAVPLAKAGHRVLAVDFSPKMLAALEAHRELEQLENLSSRQLDWNEDWLAAGIEPKSVDIAIASRSTMVADLHDAFSKLNMVARQRVCVTMATEFSPRSRRLHLAEDVRRREGPTDYVYGVNLLIQMGLYPSLSYIDTYKEDALVRWAFLSWQVPQE